MIRRPPRHDAPGEGTGDALRAPGYHELPPVDEQLAPPETRIEYFDGVERLAAPAKPPHAMKHFDLTYVLGAHVAPGYRGAVDMLTRVSETSDFAPDAAIFSTELDPTTGGRRLEELAFEISDKQALAVPTDKARRLSARGVRRVFCILVKQHRLLEWSRDTETWRTVPQDAVIEDPCLVHPLPVASLLDGVAADESVVRALLAKHVPALDAALAAREEIGRDEGLIEGLRAALRRVLKSRGMTISENVESAIATCNDAAVIERWLERAVTTDADSLTREIETTRPRR